jgi:hypothetical protein
MIVEVIQCDACGRRHRADLNSLQQKRSGILAVMNYADEDKALHFCNWKCVRQFTKRRRKLAKSARTDGCNRSPINDAALSAPDGGGKPLALLAFREELRRVFEAHFGNG